MKKQQGVAMILFVIIAPVLMMMFFLGVQGARSLQNKARIEDAVDMANMAVISQKSMDKQAAKVLAEQYVRTYMTGENDNITIKIEKLDCYDSVKCRKDSDNGKPIYTESKLLAVSNHNYWFPNPFSSEPDYDVAASSLSRKFQGMPADIYFIADMSGSMGDPFDASGNHKSKFEILTDVIQRVTKDLGIYNSRHDDKHRVAFVGYNYASRSRDKDGRVFIVRQFIYDDPLRDPWTIVRNMLQVKQPVSLVYEGGYFYDIALTDDFTAFNQHISRFQPKYSTASPEGIIRAAQVANQAVNLNENQVFIILSDGADNKPRETINLVQAGMCRQILDLFTHKKAFNGEDITVKLAIIGIDYNVKSSPAMATCVGAENVYHASSGDDVYKNIINLISEESGRLVTN